MQSIFDAHLLFFHFHFGGSTDFHEGHTAGEFRHAFLELLAIVVARGGFNLLTDALDTIGDGVLVAGSVNDGRVLFSHINPFCRTELL